MSRKRWGFSASRFATLTAATVAITPLACTSPSTITAPDCDTWATHYVEVAADVASRCNDSEWTASDAATRTRARDAFLASAKTKLAEECRKQVGRYYVTADAQCFMSSREYENWSRCNFETSFFGGFEGLREHKVCNQLLTDANAMKPPDPVPGTKKPGKK